MRAHARAGWSARTGEAGAAAGLQSPGLLDCTDRKGSSPATLGAGCPR
jgi:hypothetical protein